MEKGEVKIALVDDHTLFRTGLKGLLSQRDDFKIVADVGSGMDFLKLLPELDVDVVFMDIAMPVMDGAETTRQALRLKPEMRVITLSMFGDDHYYSLMVQSGASGFLLKDSDIEEVYSAVDAVMAGDVDMNDFDVVDKFQAGFQKPRASCSETDYCNVKLFHIFFLSKHQIIFYLKL